MANSISVPIGVAPTTSAQYVFVGATDGNVWLFHGSWQNLGSLASGVTVAQGVGVTSPGGNPSAYSIGSDGRLYATRASGGVWSSILVGSPSGVTLVKGLGTCINTSNQPFVFMLGSDGNVWLAHNTGSWLWINVGHPPSLSISGRVGATNVTPSYPQMYVIASDGSVWHLSYQGSSYVWINASASPYHPAGVIAMAGIGTFTTSAIPVGYVVGSNQHLYGVTGSTGWDDLAYIRPLEAPGIGVDPNSGAAFMIDGDSWPVAWFPGTPGHFEAYNCPLGLFPPCVQYGVGVTNNGGFDPVAFAVMSDGNMYSHSSTLVEWSPVGAIP